MKALVKDVMTTRVVVATPDASFKDMAARFRRYRVGAFPVVDDAGKVVGVVSEGDLLSRHAVMLAREALTGGADGEEIGEVTAAGLITHAAVTIAPDEPVENAARLMYNCRVRRLPVVDRDGRLVGIISRADVLAVFDRTDEQIAREITDRAIRPGLLDGQAEISVSVRGGVVTVTGSPASAAQGHDMVRTIRHIEGVVAVRDRLSYPDHQQKD